MRKLTTVFLLAFSTFCFGQRGAINKPLLGARINLSNPLAKGLMGAWIFNEGSGTKVSDLSENGHTGTFTGVTSRPAWSIGESGVVVDYKNTANGESVDIPSLTATTNKSYVMRIKADSFTGSFNTLIEFGADSPWFGVRSTGAVELFSANPSTATILSTDRWYDIVVTSANGLSKIYIDGIVDSNTGTGNTQVGSGMGIGFHSGDTSWQGEIEYVYIYNRALTAAEVQLIHREPYAMFERPRVLAVEAAAPSPTTRRRIIITHD